MPQIVTTPDAMVDEVLARVGPKIVLGLPLGLGKACHLANALYVRARTDKNISLTILTALTLQAPEPDNEFAARFLDPLTDRFFAGYPQLGFVQDLASGDLPSNVVVREFFLQPGQWLGNATVQQEYVSLNYTHVQDYLVNAGINVIGQLVAAPAEVPRGQPAARYSLSCNADITADLMDMRAAGTLQCLFVGERNPDLPYMHGAADRDATDFDLMLDAEAYDYPLFMPPHEHVSLADHAIGLQVARLIPDGGTLQIGIGSIGDAIAHALILRHRENSGFRELADALDPLPATLPEQHTSFVAGLYGLSEMLVEGFLDLIDAGVLRRRVDGTLIHAGFFVGSPLFYRKLSKLEPDVRRAISMMPVSFVNQVYGTEDKKALDRVSARFVNSALMCTLLGAVVSDTLESGQVISGVGGQYNFIAQAFALHDARSIITLPATRTHKGETRSNIRWAYGQTTIPRHLRDIVVTEYGVADLRGQSDAAVVAALLNICDSRFQESLLTEAKKAGKIAADYRVPERHRSNTPAKIRTVLRPFAERGELPGFPLGSDLTEVEQQLVPALDSLKQYSGSLRGILTLLRRGISASRHPMATECLQRMGLDKPGSLKDRFYRRLLLGALNADDR